MFCYLLINIKLIKSIVVFPVEIQLCWDVEMVNLDDYFGSSQNDKNNIFINVGRFKVPH